MECICTASENRTTASGKELPLDTLKLAGVAISNSISHLLACWIKSALPASYITSTICTQITALIYHTHLPAQNIEN